VNWERTEENVAKRAAANLAAQPVFVSNAKLHCGCGCPLLTISLLYDPSGVPVSAWRFRPPAAFVEPVQNVL
jgi:hypothetical protein